MTDNSPSLPEKKVLFHDLDYLAGTWTEEEFEEFEEIIKTFEVIDKEMW